MPNEIKADKPLKDFREVIKIIGIDAAEVLCAQFGGSSIYVPKTVNILVRNMKIREDYKSMPIYALHRKYNLSESQIRTIVNMKQFTIEDYLMED